MSAAESFDVRVTIAGVKREQAEYLHDEIESLVTIVFGRILERQGGDLDVYKKLERTVTPRGLSAYLVEELKHDLEVLEINTVTDYLTYNRLFHVRINVPAPFPWVSSFGKDELSDRLENAIDFLKQPTQPRENLAEQDLELMLSVPLLNGDPISPVVGVLYYDNLKSEMKTWTGSKWNIVTPSGLPLFPPKSRNQQKYEAS